MGVNFMCIIDKKNFRTFYVKPYIKSPDWISSKKATINPKKY